MVTSLQSESVEIFIHNLLSRKRGSRKHQSGMFDASRDTSFGEFLVKVRRYELDNSCYLQFIIIAREKFFERNHA
jgi:hypothetical protein